MGQHARTLLEVSKSAKGNYPYNSTELQVLPGFLARAEADRVVSLLPQSVDAWHHCADYDVNHAHVLCFDLPLVSDPLLPRLLQRYATHFSAAFRRRVSVANVKALPIVRYEPGKTLGNVHRDVGPRFLLDGKSPTEYQTFLYLTDAPTGVPAAQAAATIFPTAGAAGVIVAPTKGTILSWPFSTVHAAGALASGAEPRIAVSLSAVLAPEEATSELENKSRLSQIVEHVKERTNRGEPADAALVDEMLGMLRRYARLRSLSAPAKDDERPLSLENYFNI